MQNGVQIVSVNVNGLNAQNKRRRIFKQLIKIKADITCIQETRIKDGDQKFLSCPKLGNLFYASDSKKKKGGVATYITEELKPKLIEKTSDGRILVTEITKDGKRIMLLNIYVPSDKVSGFFQTIQSILRKYGPQKVIIMGDFNAIFDKDLGSH